MSARLSTHRYGRHLADFRDPTSWDNLTCAGCPAVFVGGTPESQQRRFEAHVESGQCPGIQLLSAP